MAKDPAILFYTSDFLTGTFTMTNEQVGKYIKLLCLQHQKGRLTEKDMLNICQTYDKDIYDKFIVEDGLYYNKRMDLEAIRRKNYSKSRSENRSNKDVKNISETYVKHMEAENVIEDIDLNLNKEFEDFWDLYDKKVGDKKKLFIKWKKLKDEDKTKIFIHIPKYKSAIPDKQFRKNPETYLNNNSWNDEIITRNENGIYRNSNNPSSFRSSSDDTDEFHVIKAGITS